MPSLIERKNIFLDILFTVLTAGFFNIWVQYRQIRDVNTALGEDRYSFLKMFFFSLVTFGLYFIWHEFKMTQDLQIKSYGKDGHEIPLLAAIATAMGLWFVVDSYQQAMLNDLASR